MDAADSVSSKFLAELRIDAGGAGLRVGTTPLGVRRIGVIHGGSAEGPAFSGRLAPGGGDWALVSRDDCIHIDFRGVVETQDGAGIYIKQYGRLHAPDEVRPALMDRERWHELDPSTYYFRTAAFFETAAPQYDWLNRVVAVGLGRHGPQRVAYRLHAVL